MRIIDRRSFLYAVGAAGVAAWQSAGVRAASSGPATVMLMRHGEDIGEDSFHLSPKGMKRAEALPKLFGARLPKPDVIIATHATKGSNRPIETVEPLAKALHLPIDNRFKDDDYEILAKDLLTDARFAGKVVLVCWHHGKMAKLAKALGVKGAPRWPDAQFDHVWVIEYGKKGGAHMEDVRQQLLEGDA
jgi:phosphohistidine phosphatase SixA